MKELIQLLSIFAKECFANKSWRYLLTLRLRYDTIVTQEVQGRMLLKRTIISFQQITSCTSCNITILSLESGNLNHMLIIPLHIFYFCPITPMYILRQAHIQIIIPLSLYVIPADHSILSNNTPTVLITGPKSIAHCGHGTKGLLDRLCYRGHQTSLPHLA